MSSGSTTHHNNVGMSLRRLRQILAESAFPPGVGTQSRPVADPFMLGGLARNSFLATPQLFFGVITDVTAVAHCYRVTLERGQIPITCFNATTGNYGAFGVRDMSTLVPGTEVITVVHPQAYYGAIIAVIPPAGFDARQQILEQIAHTTRNRVDEAHFQPFKQGGRGFVTSWSAGRPFDATAAGEFGRITETGLRMMLDSFMGQFGVNEVCGVFPFYHDQLLRIAAYNLRMFTAGSEREAFNDQGEYNDWTGYTPYPWEQLGLFAPGDPFIEKEPQAWQIDEPHYGPLEPRVDTMRPWHRELEYHGYLGQGGLRIVQTMPANPPAQAEFLGTQPTYPGLAMQWTGLDGRVLMGSAKGISITKRGAILSPARRYVPEQIQSEGDNAQNYRPAGRTGGGPEHKITDTLEITADHASLQRAAGLLDLHAYLFNYATVHAFSHHQQDWTTPDEADLGQPTIEVPAYGDLADKPYLPPPQPRQLTIDHRYGDAQYWPNNCGIELLEDGGVVIYDGWGSEIVMSGGTISINAAGDIWRRSGRSIIDWAGDDVCVRAKNSIDITTTEKDLRLKSKKNMQVLAEQGGILLESRAAWQADYEKVGEDVKSGGIMLRCEQGDVATWAGNIYLRTGGEDFVAGNIVLDAGKGQQDVLVHAKEFQAHLDSSLTLHFGVEGNIRRTTLFDEDQAIISGSLSAAGAGTFGGNVQLRGSLLAAGGHVLTEDGASNQFVAPLQGEALSAVNSAVSSVLLNTQTLQPSQGQVDYTTKLEIPFYASGKPGNDEVLRRAEFGLRTVDQYGTQNFVLPEARWQQMGQSLLTATWEEQPVVSRADPETYPYPGKENFTGNTLLSQPLELFQISSSQGRAKKRSEGSYDNPRFASPELKNLNEYKVIR